MILPKIKEGVVVLVTSSLLVIRRVISLITSAPSFSRSGISEAARGGGSGLFAQFSSTSLLSMSLTHLSLKAQTQGLVFL